MISDVADAPGPLARPAPRRRALLEPQCPIGMGASSNSRNKPVTTKATCSPISTASSAIRSIARAASSIVIAHSRRSASIRRSQGQGGSNRGLRLCDHIVAANQVLRQSDVARSSKCPLRLNIDRSYVGAHAMISFTIASSAGGSSRRSGESPCRCSRTDRRSVDVLDVQEGRESTAGRWPPAIGWRVREIRLWWTSR